jgi:hypothetical protein
LIQCEELALALRDMKRIKREVLLIPVVPTLNLDIATDRVLLIDQEVYVILTALSDRVAPDSLQKAPDGLLSYCVILIMENLVKGFTLH